MTLRVHPRKTALGAWFDGEGPDRVGSHVARCGRCRRHVSDLARLRSWLRAQPFVAMGEEREGATGTTAAPRRHPLALIAVLVVTFVLVADRSGDPGRAPGTPSATSRSSAQLAAPSTTGTGTPAAPSAASPAPDRAPRPGPERARPAPGDRALAAAATTAGPPLRLGLVVPTAGPLAAEGAEVAEVVRRRVDAANAAGGVAGLPVSLEVAAAEDPAAVTALAQRVTVLVGGFGAAPGVTAPWLLPADPSVTGDNVLPAELAPRQAGAQLGALLRRQGVNGPVGVVVGGGPDTALAAGLASRVPTTTVSTRRDSTCVAEVAALARSGAVALAVAGEPDLAAQCLRAVARSPWRPPFGTLVAPSAAYGRLDMVPEALGARTVLGLPWPTSPAPGAARFRANTNSVSYRALVSYAATELAIDVARQKGTVSLSSVATGTWRTDLVDLDPASSRPGSIVMAFLGAWITTG